VWHWHVLYLYVRIPVVMLLFVVVGGGWVAVYLAGLLSESQGPICEEPVCLCSCGDDRGDDDLNLTFSCTGWKPSMVLGFRMSLYVLLVLFFGA